MLGVHQCKNHRSNQILHAGPFSPAASGKAGISPTRRNGGGTKLQFFSSLRRGLFPRPHSGQKKSSSCSIKKKPQKHGKQLSPEKHSAVSQEAIQRINKSKALRDMERLETDT